jgi:hypothetical protein
VLAGARESGDNQSKTTWRFETDRPAGRHVGGISPDSYRWLLTSWEVANELMEICASQLTMADVSIRIDTVFHRIKTGSNHDPFE